MTGTVKIFERCCRLCAEEQEVTLMLLSTEAADMLLLEKLRKYLLIEIDENDKFPKNICIRCCSKLQTLCEFIELVRKAQDSLRALSSTIEQLNSPTSTINAIKEETTEFTEVCIDPMDVLNMSGEICTEPFTYPYADEVVTLKLLPKDNNDEIETEENIWKKRFECEVCDKSFRVEQSLKNHSWIHIREEDYSCFTCQRSFKFQSDLDKHIKFKKKLTYDAHMQIHKPTTKAYTCKICGRSYANWAGLKMHKVTHSSEKPFHCSMCDKKFKRNQELKARNHTNANFARNALPVLEICMHIGIAYIHTGPELRKTWKHL
ncbi:putative zinc finger protein [Operophtera brumata]|uniref:Putative zinc finger protein n=1 Tax=Operophtera brumata TaxID=104452 RepID=A0A0L7L8N1_OPEBR|nr:putative zinc finger protein [Operophtera brumata]